MNENSIRIKETFDKLYLNEKQLSSGQTQFIEGCKKYFRKNKSLSEKQSEALFEITKYLKTESRITMSI